MKIFDEWAFINEKSHASIKKIVISTTILIVRKTQSPKTVPLP